ncbi:hypothetical protein SISNIDRAFT_486899 [Sistotremastrum niveocremeum HHB9708]|uniref:Uncharacterized protein n=1 Tax=Sistotremastrum niveocremeum HHB9708 TaxID=1314777 RepID=A0A164T064_9AGAM|nr:hypothetical protein SISNIDRAFT_486899 [Sistotremastrum niveocremeum HHB9708]
MSTTLTRTTTSTSSQVFNAPLGKSRARTDRYDPTPISGSLLLASRPLPKPKRHNNAHNYTRHPLLLTIDTSPSTIGSKLPIGPTKPLKIVKSSSTAERSTSVPRPRVKSSAIFPVMPPISAIIAPLPSSVPPLPSTPPPDMQSFAQPASYSTPSTSSYSSASYASYSSHTSYYHTVNASSPSPQKTYTPTHRLTPSRPRTSSPLCPLPTQTLPSRPRFPIGKRRVDYYKIALREWWKRSPCDPTSPKNGPCKKGGKRALMAMGVSVAVRLWSANRELEKLIEMCGSPTSGDGDGDMEDGMIEDIGEDPFRAIGDDVEHDSDADVDGMDEEEAAEVIADGELDVDVEKDIDMDETRPVPTLTITSPSPCSTSPELSVNTEKNISIALSLDCRADHHLSHSPPESSMDADQPASKKVKLSPFPSSSSTPAISTSDVAVLSYPAESPKAVPSVDDDWEWIDNSGTLLPYLTSCTALPTATLPASAPLVSVPLVGARATSGYEGLEGLGRMERRQARMIVCR